MAFYHPPYYHQESCPGGGSPEFCSGAASDQGVEKAVYTLENLGCASCAAKMERIINDLPEVQHASIAFATKQLRLAAPDHEGLLPRLQEIVGSIESDVRIVAEKKNAAAKTAVFQVENLKTVADGDAIAAALRGLPGVLEAALDFSGKQLRLTAASPLRLQPQIEKIAKDRDPAITLTLKDGKPKKELKKESFFAKEGNGDLLLLGIGGVLFLAALATSGKTPLSLGLYIAAYLVLGHKVLRTAAGNIFKGRVFDENFLMSIASLGAFAVGEYPEAVAVMMFFFVGEIFEDRAVAKSRNQIMDAVDLRPETVNLLVADEVAVIPAADAMVGDILLVRPGDRIPLDGTVVEGESRIDTSPVTGESVPVRAVFGSEVISGCINRTEQLKIRVEKVLSESMVTRILDSVEQAAASKPKLDRFITRFARVYTPFVVVLAAATAVVPSLLTGDWYHWIYTALTFLVISCPCALVLSVPLAYFAGIGFSSRNGILFKGGIALEALKEVKAVVLDKTGTVTKGNFEVTEILPAPGFAAADLLAAAASAELSSTHPIAASIVAAAKARSLGLQRPQALKEVPGRGVAATWGNKEVLCGNRQLLEAAGLSVPALEADFYGTEVLVAIDGVFAGRLLIADTVKSDAKEAVAAIAALGLTTAMLTGDRQEAAAAIAAETGLDEVHAKLLPQDKVTVLQRLREKHGRVMFVGDGINDAPVLAGADVGAAMGSGADAAIEAADVVFMTSEMKAVPLSLKIAGKVGRVALENVVFALAVKGLVMVLGLAGFANMWLAIFADTGVAMICIINSVRILYSKNL